MIEKGEKSYISSTSVSKNRQSQGQYRSRGSCDGSSLTRKLVISGKGICPFITLRQTLWIIDGQMISYKTPVILSFNNSTY